MRTLSCDVCHTKIEAPISGRNSFHLAHRDVCEGCHDKLQTQIKPVVRTKQPFNYDWYTRLVQESVEKAIQKGKFEAR